ncbi:progranulin isoform X2 [Neopsephotus bourkii]|uniref:progranulin isoform X2 n=1 Tax=Neopsephotus bourkii TaxID=309878 RepID=UPI002AA52454|nr:progranulin isoform X2 [Neopsephotus bourkii]
MRTLLLLWLVLSGASAWCHDGQPCPSTPVLRASSAVPCRDGSSCPSTGSCPLPESVPCADGHHCCPRGSRCSADGESCITPPAPRAVPCPDGQSECPDDATCCVTASGAWGCCPMPQASCCADKVHCCPHATVCDLAHGRCLSPAGDTPMGTTFPAWKRQPLVSVALHQVLCPDGRSACPDGATCCQMSPAHYGCCPLQNAVCCSDGQHCCPQGTVCDLERSTCTSLGGREPLQAFLPKAREVKCDEETSCPSGNTCCRLSSGAWGCCPLEEAVCCKDHQHCCPWGYTCNVATQSCEKLLTPALLLGAPTSPPRAPTPRPAPLRAAATDPTAAVPCGAARSCRAGHRCCRTRGGSWGCCPFTQGSCCSDGRHCCPVGSRCTGGGWGCSPQRWDLPAPRRVLL